jgi:hypothetical protein
MRITTPTQADVDDATVSQAVGEARSRSVSSSPSKMMQRPPQTDFASAVELSRPLADAAARRNEPPSNSRRLRTMLSADLSHHEMFGVRAIQQDVSKARNKSQQIAVLVQYVVLRLPNKRRLLSFCVLCGSGR